MMNKKFLSGAVLKWIAMITMLIDHFACSFYMASYSCGRPIFSYDLYLILRAIGRAAFPIYCFLLVEGFLHTRNVHKYLFRLLCFGIVSEVPFDMAAEGSFVYWGHQNVFFTLFLGLMAILVLRYINEQSETCNSCPKWMNRLLGFISVACFAVCAEFCNTDYGAYGVIVIAAFYIFKTMPYAQYMSCFLVLALQSSFELWAIPDIFLFYFYNGERGKQPKYLFYVFYPLHLLILGVLTMVIYRA